MLYDILRETRAYQEMTKDSREQGRLEGLREALLKIVQTRFPDHKMIRQARGQAAIIDDPEVLQDLIVKVSMAQTPEEAEQHLLDWPGADNEQDKL